MEENQAYPKYSFYVVYLVCSKRYPLGWFLDYSVLFVIFSFWSKNKRFTDYILYSVHRWRTVFINGMKFSKQKWKIFSCWVQSQITSIAPSLALRASKNFTERNGVPMKYTADPRFCQGTYLTRINFSLVQSTVVNFEIKCLILKAIFGGFIGRFVIFFVLFETFLTIFLAFLGPFKPIFWAFSRFKLLKITRKMSQFFPKWPSVHSAEFFAVP